TGSGASRTYTPAANYHGPDSFDFVVSDGPLTSAPATVTIDVASVEDPPLAHPVSVALPEDTVAAGTPLGSDGGGDPRTCAVATQPAHGTLAGTPPALSYTPDPNFNGADSFIFTVSSNGETSAPATVTITVTPVNDPPVASDVTVTTLEDTPVSFALP